MPAAFAFLRFAAKAALNAVGVGIVADFAVEVLPEVARDVWRWWGNGRNPADLRTEIEAVAALPTAQARQLAEEVVAQQAAGLPEAVRQKVTAYVAQMPEAIRQSQRRPQDPSGRSLSSRIQLRTAEDLIPLLPPRPPLFKVGDHPPGAGDWELEELLGMGGFGEVWKAKNPYMPKPVVFKFCLDREAAKALRNEAALLARVARQGQHPRIVRLLNTNLRADPPYLEYEYVAGGDLAAFVYQQMQRSKEGLSPDLAVQIVFSLARTVGHAHLLDPPIVHRDLKPANILVERLPEANVQFHITDFGIGGVAASQAVEQAKGASTGHFQATALRGAHTPLYASPQQIEGALPDPRDDVHALGVIWYQMLIGDFSVGAPTGLWFEELERKGVSRDLIRLLGACVALRPKDRPANASLLAEQIAATIERRVRPMRWVLPGGAVLGERKRGGKEPLVACRPGAAILERTRPASPPGVKER